MQIYWGAWGGSWGMSWAGAWGASWGPDEVEEHPERYSGGGRRRMSDDERLHREHWDYMDGLRAARETAGAVRVHDEARNFPVGAALAAIHVPDAQGARAMRGTIKTQTGPPSVAAVLGNPLILAALALMMDDDD